MKTTINTPSNVMFELIASMIPTASDGKLEDQHGNSIKVENIKDHEKDSNNFVVQSILACARVSDTLSQLRSELESEFDGHVKSLFEQYNKKMGGKKGNVTVFSFDRKLKLECSKQERETTNEHIIVAKQLVDGCVKNWSKGANKNLQSFVSRYFRTDADGNYNVSDLKRLRKMELAHPDEDWDKAMEALDNSIEFDTTATYFRAYYRDENGSYIQIPLDIAKINAIRPEQSKTNSANAA